MNVESSSEWHVVVPAMELAQADKLWHEWWAHTPRRLQPEDIRVDLHRTDDGCRRQYSVRGINVLCTEDFLENLRQVGAEVRGVVDEHLAHYDGYLLHLLVADLRRLTESTSSATFDARSELLLVLADALDQGDAAVCNAIAVSFVHDSQPWDLSMVDLVQSWPEPLRREARRQMESHEMNVDR